VLSLIQIFETVTGELEKVPFTLRQVAYVATEPVNVQKVFTVTPSGLPTPGNKSPPAAVNLHFWLPVRVGCDSFIRHFVPNHFVANASVVQNASLFCPTITTSSRSRRLDPAMKPKMEAI